MRPPGPAPLLALVAVTAVWGLTFVQVKDAVELYPLFAFLTLRFAIASMVLAVPAAKRLGSLGRSGWVAGSSLGLLLALLLSLHTAVGCSDNPSPLAPSAAPTVPPVVAQPTPPTLPEPRRRSAQRRAPVQRRPGRGIDA